MSLLALIQEIQEENRLMEEFLRRNVYHHHETYPYYIGILKSIRRGLRCFSEDGKVSLEPAETTEVDIEIKKHTPKGMQWVTHDYYCFYPIVNISPGDIVRFESKKISVFFNMFYYRIENIRRLEFEDIINDEDVT